MGRKAGVSAGSDRAQHVADKTLVADAFHRPASKQHAKACLIQLRKIAKFGVC